MDRPTGRSAPALVLAAVFLLAAFTLLPHPSAAQVGTSTLGGRVCSVDQNVAYIRAPDPGDVAGCGASLADATLRLTKAGVAGTAVGAVDKSATSDGNGTYQFTTLADGAYTLAVSRVGYADVSLNVTVSGATVRDVGLHPKVVEVSGKVVDTGGAAVGYARVDVCCGPTVGSVEATTDAAGAFAVKTESGLRSFSIAKDGRFLATLQRFVDGSAAITLTVPPAPRPDAALHGTVTDQDGHPLAGVQVNVYSNGYYPQPEPMPADSGSAAGGGSGSAGSGTASPGTTSEPNSSSTTIARPVPPCCYGGSNTTTTDGAGHYAMRIFGGSGVSVSVYLPGYANYNKGFQVAQGEDRLLDIQLLKFPAKTAHVEGRLVDAATGAALRYASISAQSPAYGLYECSMDAADANNRTTPQPMPAQPATANGKMAPDSMPQPAPGCAITIQADGSFSGNLTPGYTILNVYYDAYRACPQTGGMYKPCQPEYYPWSEALKLAAGATTQVTVRLEQRPAPDAVVSGYVLDEASGKPIPGAQVSFSNDDGYGYGAATTDQDGSYRIRLRSGHLSVYASAEGHLHWQGSVTVKAGETPLDLTLPVGDEANGYCCVIYGGKGIASSSGVAAPSAAGGGPTAQQADSARNGATASTYEDLHGGLGPYDAKARAKQVASATGHASPAPAAALTLLALLGVAFLRRSREFQ